MASNVVVVLHAGRRVGKGLQLAPNNPCDSFEDCLCVYMYHIDCT